MFGQITDREVNKELKRRGLYTSALVTPPVTPVTPIRERRKPIVTPPPYITPIPPYTTPVTPYTPPVIPVIPEDVIPSLIPELDYEEEIPFRMEEPPTEPSEPVVVFPRGYREEREYIPYIPGITPPVVTVPVIPTPVREGFVLTKTHLIAGAVLLGVIFFFGGAPAAARAAARAPARAPEGPSTRARARTVTEVY